MRCGSPYKVRTRMGQLWTKRKQSENGDAHVWHSHKDKGEDTEGFCVIFIQRKVGQFHSEKGQKGVAVHTKKG